MQISRVLTIVALILAFWVPLVRAHTRIAWETQTPRITTRVTPAETDGACPDVARVAALRGRLLSLDQKDVCLYAVFLDSEDSFSELTRILHEVGSPSVWRLVSGKQPRLQAFLSRRASYEWLELKPNGALTVYADDHRQPGKNFLVVVNGAGDVVGFRPLWKSSQDLAALR